MLEQQLRTDIQALMEERGFTAYAIADSAGISGSTLRRWLAGAGSIRVETLGFILEALNMALVMRPEIDLSKYTAGYVDASLFAIRAIDDGYNIKTNIRHAAKLVAGTNWREHASQNPDRAS